MGSSGETKDGRGVQVAGKAERVLAVDPTAVWALVADPARVGEWAGVATVGYMGTELPKTGQAVFVRTRRWQRSDKARRVEIESWEAGTGYRCRVERSNARSPMLFEVSIKPEVSADGIATRIRLTQRMNAPSLVAGMLCRYVSARLERKLDRIEASATG